MIIWSIIFKLIFFCLMCFLNWLFPMFKSQTHRKVSNPMSAFRCPIRLEELYRTKSPYMILVYFWFFLLVISKWCYRNCEPTMSQDSKGCFSLEVFPLLLSRIVQFTDLFRLSVFHPLTGITFYRISAHGMVIIHLLLLITEGNTN